MTENCVVFFCDDCGKTLDPDDKGTPYWEDYDRFLETVGQDDEEPTLFLCRRCLADRGGRPEEGECPG